MGNRYENDWRVYACASASDAKGPIIAFMAALDALAAQGLGPTVNLRVIMDGEEEISSPNLVPRSRSIGTSSRPISCSSLTGPWLHH